MCDSDEEFQLIDDVIKCEEDHDFSVVLSDDIITEQILDNNYSNKNNQKTEISKVTNNNNNDSNKQENSTHYKEQEELSLKLKAELKAANELTQELQKQKEILAKERAAVKEALLAAQSQLSEFNKAASQIKEKENKLNDKEKVLTNEINAKLKKIELLNEKNEKEKLQRQKEESERAELERQREAAANENGTDGKKKVILKKLDFESLGKGDIYSCKNCNAHIGLDNDVESKCYQVGTGAFTEKKRGYLFKTAFNLALGETRKETFTTGTYDISFVSCKGCDSSMGWKYLACDSSENNSKVGKYCLARFSLDIVQ